LSVVPRSHDYRPPRFHHPFSFPSSSGRARAHAPLPQIWEPSPIEPGRAAWLGSERKERSSETFPSSSSRPRARSRRKKKRAGRCRWFGTEETGSFHLPPFPFPVRRSGSWARTFPSRRRQPPSADHPLLRPHSKPRCAFGGLCPGKPAQPSLSSPPSAPGPCDDGGGASAADDAIAILSPHPHSTRPAAGTTHTQSLVSSCDPGIEEAAEKGGSKDGSGPDEAAGQGVPCAPAGRGRVIILARVVLRPGPAGPGTGISAIGGLSVFCPRLVRSLSITLVLVVCLPRLARAPRLWRSMIRPCPA
jgi:hypothetical protein